MNGFLSFEPDGLISSHRDLRGSWCSSVISLGDTREAGGHTAVGRGVVSAQAALDSDLMK